MSDDDPWTEHRLKSLEEQAKKAGSPQGCFEIIGQLVCLATAAFILWSIFHRLEVLEERCTQLDAEISCLLLNE